MSIRAGLREERSFNNCVTAEFKYPLFISFNFVSSMGGFTPCSSHFFLSVKRLHIFDAAGGPSLVTEGEGIECSVNLLLNKDERHAASLCKECGLMTCWQNTEHLRIMSLSNYILKTNHFGNEKVHKTNPAKQKIE